MHDSLDSLVVGAVVGFISAIIAGHFVNEINRRQRRKLVLRSLYRELSEFIGHLKLEALAADDLPLVSTINITLLERAFTDNVWDYDFDSKLIGILADIIERTKRFNENVRVVNSFTFSVWLTEGDSVSQVREYLHHCLQESVSQINDRVHSLAAELDHMLHVPGE